MVNLLYRRKDIIGPLEGVGFVVPKSEDMPITACSFSSIKFKGRTPADTLLLRCFVGGSVMNKFHDSDDSCLSSIVHDKLSRLMGIRSQPLFTMVKRNRASMPQYTLGHLERTAQISARAEMHRGMELAGNAYDGVGVPDCIRSGEQAAEKIFKYIQNTSQRA